MTGSHRKNEQIGAPRIESRGRALARDPIRFGTSGWRGVLGGAVTFPRLRVLVRSVADWVREQEAGDRVLIGFDGRFASRDMAEMTARILVDEGLDPVLAKRVTPTPAIAHALGRRRCAAGLVLTASHNPSPYHGMKVFGSWGGSVTDSHIRRIEQIAVLRSEDEGPPHSDRLGRRIDFNLAYQDAIKAHLDPDAFRESGLTVIYDAMHGAGAGVLDSVIESAGAQVRCLRGCRDPEFGGDAPDPVAERLGELSAQTKGASGLKLGLATDGDGDRFGVVDGRGVFLTETQVIALLVDHLATTGQVRRGVAITAATGSLVERVAADHGLPVERFPIGFKSLSAAMHEGRADVAGEESGGFALASMSRDKDGIFADCLLANLVATSGQPLEWHIERLESRFGRSACGRTAILATPELYRALERIEADPPVCVGRTRVAAVDGRCGLRLGLADGGFVMLRRSGTEPMLRVYAEAADTEGLERRLGQSRRLLEQAAKVV
jgi:phosphoglucomutase